MSLRLKLSQQPGSLAHDSSGAIARMPFSIPKIAGPAKRLIPECGDCPDFQLGSPLLVILVMIFGGVGTAHTTKNHYMNTTILNRKCSDVQPLHINDPIFTDAQFLLQPSLVAFFIC
jgi:hypothetical protein